MKKLSFSVSPLVVAACVLLLPLGSNVFAGIFVPAGLNPGDKYHLAFVSSTSRDATSPDIGVYNSFVQAAADAAGIGASEGVVWKAIACTTTVKARDNALVSAPVYRMDGQQLATGFSDLWSSALNASLSLDENGQTITSIVWTGTNPDGGQASHPLGITVPINTGFTAPGELVLWIKNGEHHSPSINYALYALSSELTVGFPDCGNGTLDPDEACDGGIGCTGCGCDMDFESTVPVSLDCQLICGNGILDPGEDCDGGVGCTDCGCDMDFESTVPLSLDCQLICGNGILDPGEACDGGIGCTGCGCDAGFEPTAPLSLDCQPICGNGILDPGEACDGGIGCTGCGCDAGFEPTVPLSLDCQPICGNGILDPGEACDGGLGCTGCGCDAGFEPTVPLSLDCQPKCGNGILDPGEACDGGLGCTGCGCDMGFEPTFPLSLDCQPICGNGILDPGEECDVAADAACPGLCQIDCLCAPFCGDGTCDPGEDPCNCPPDCLGDDCDMNGTPDVCEGTRSINFCVKCNSSSPQDDCSTGTAWSFQLGWPAPGPVFENLSCGPVIPTAGTTAQDMAAEFVDCVNSTVCPSITAVQFGSGKCFRIVVPGTVAPEICVGPVGGPSNACCPPPACTFNPGLVKVLLANEDCNGNNVDDAIDIALETSKDDNRNGIPDECEPVLPAVSEWGLIVMALLLLTGLKIKFGRRKPGGMPA